jgi:hypothetical protein
VRLVGAFVLAGAIVLSLVAVVVDQETDGAHGLVYVLYVVLGVAAAGYGGLLTAAVREASALVDRAREVIEPRLQAAVARLPVPKTGVEPKRLRRLVETQLPLPRRTGRVAGLLFSLRLLDLAGMQALRERLLALADIAEERGDPVVPQALVEAVAREGILRAVAARFVDVLRVPRLIAYALLAVALLWLPLIAAID